MAALTHSFGSPAGPDLLISSLVRNAATGANGTGGHGGAHKSAALCADKIPSCRLQSAADCTKEDCSNLITALIFPFFAIAIGIFLQPLTKYVKQLPYTLFLLFSGFLIGIIGCNVDLGMLNTSLKQWVHLSPPNLFFYIFLAPLIFEAAFVTQWHIFKRLLIPILTAAFVIVILQVGLIGGFTMLVVSKDQKWDWWSALMFGAMLSATDPISVTATLKALGASENLGTMIEGESLVNDGSAFVLWETFFHNAEAEHSNTIDTLSIPTIIGVIAKSAFGGMFLGILFAIVALLILTFVYDEFEVETSLTVVVAFLGFWAAQSPAKLSGVICNVASGLMLSAYGRPLISKSVRHPLAEFWELLGWIANTIVFIHSGVLTIAFVWPCESSPHYAKDYLLIFGYFLFLQVIRVVLFMVFLPLLSFRNKWFGWKEDLLVGLSGLRGAVSLILALNVAGASPIPEAVRSRVFLWSTGIVALSLIVNGLAIPQLLALLKLDGADNTREDFLSRARATMTQATLSTLDSLCVDVSFKGARWSYIVRSVVPQKWLEDDEYGRHYAKAAEQLHNNVASHRMSLEFMLTEQRRASTHADLRARTSTEMLHSAPQTHEPNRLSLSHAPAQGMVAPPYNTDEKASKSQGLRDSMPPIQYEKSLNTPVINPVPHSPAYDSSRNRRSLDYDAAQYNPSAGEREKFSKRIQTELAAMHGRQIDATYDDEDDDHDSALDREIRRRMLMGMLSHVRHLSNTTVVEYSALVSMEEDVMTALDENDEEREYDLFKVLNRKSFFNRVLSRFFDEKKFDAELVVIATVVFQIMSEILKQEGLSRSKKVSREAMNLYEGAAYMLNRLETHNFKAYRWILSQFAVHTVVAKQDAALHDMHHGGVIDAYEHKILSRELQDVRRRHSVNARSVWKKSKKTPGDLVSFHPLFGDKLVHFTELTKLPTVTVRAGHRLRLEEGTLVVVVKGALRPVARSAPKMSESSSGDASGDRHGIASGNLATKPTVVGHGGSVQHWSYSQFTGYLGPKTVTSINNEQGGPPCRVNAGRLGETQFAACDIADETTVFTLQSSLVRETSIQSKQFRDEVTRFMAREFVLDTLVDEESHHLRLINEALANKIDDSTVLGRAYSLLEKLPYMSVIRLHAGEKLGGTAPPQTTLRGPGMLINGTVRVSVVDTSGLAGATNLLHERLEGPALLPAENLIIQECAPTGSEEERAGSRHRSDGLGPVLAHVLILEHTRIDETARARLKRWTAEDDTVDMNGRFGMIRIITNVARQDAVDDLSRANLSNRRSTSAQDSVPTELPHGGDNFV